MQTRHITGSQTHIDETQTKYRIVMLLVQAADGVELRWHMHVDSVQNRSEYDNSVDNLHFKSCGTQRSSRASR